MIDRRLFVAALPAVFANAAARGAQPSPHRHFDPAPIAAAVRVAEALTGGRVGLAVDAGDGRIFNHRGSERFPMASTFKMLLAAAILERVDRGFDRLDRAIPVAAADILGNSPVSERHVGGTATVVALAEATMIYSDNTAANLLLPAIGGPAGLTAFVRRIGDPVTRLDRIEPAMSEARPGDARDTTSPDAILATWRTLLFGTVLSPASRTQLRQWLEANTTGNTRLRAGLPKTWRIGDKTGTGGDNSVNDIAVAVPDHPGARPILIASFINGGSGTSESRNRVHADLARAIAEAVGQVRL